MMVTSLANPRRAQSWDGDDGLTSLSQSLQEILHTSPTPSPPNPGRKARLIRSASSRAPPRTVGSPNLARIQEECSSPTSLPPPRLRRNVTFSHMPTNLFADDE